MWGLKKKLILGLFLVTLLCLSFTSARIINCNETVYPTPDYLYHFDENTGDISYEQCYGINNVSNVSNFNWIPAKYNSGVKFDGEGSYFVTDNNDNSFTGKNLTVSVWVNFTEYFAHDQIMVGRHFATATRDFELEVEADGDVSFTTYSACSGSFFLYSNVSLNFNQLHHIVGVLDHGVNKKIYIDGVLTGVTTSGDTIPDCGAQPTSIGSNVRNPPNSDLNATIDEVAIWHYPLNASQVEYIYSDCVPNWSAQYTSCNITDERLKYYVDLNLCGTNESLPVDNSTVESCDFCTPTFGCTSYNASCSGDDPKTYFCIEVNDTTSCCDTTNLTSDCNFTGDYSDYDLNYTVHILENSTLSVPTYHYVDVNTSYDMFLDILTNNMSDIKIYLWNESLNLEIFNFTWDGDYYTLSLLFTEIGDYAFVINGTNPCNTMSGEITGVFLVRDSFNINFCGFESKDTPEPYENEFAYLIAELTTSKQHYNEELERFITPLGFKTLYDTPVFHALYRDGCANITLYEPNQEYAIRLFDGVATFPTTFSPPNITETYGTNIYFGEYTFNGSDMNYRVYLSDKDIRPYFWAYNYVYIFLMIIAFFVAVVLFFIIPDKPLIAITMGVGFVGALTLIRLVVWFYFGIGMVFLR